MRIRFIREARLLAGCSLLMLSFTGLRAAEATPTGPTFPQCVAVMKTSSPVSFLSRENGPAQVAHDARTNATFAFSLTSDGAARMVVKAGELEAEKIVYADGHFRIEARTGNDSVAVAVAAGSIDVERHNHRTHLDSKLAADDDWLRASELVAGSKALRLFRALAANLDDATLQTPGGAGVVLGDAALGMLGGDVDAAGRLRRQMRAAHQARIRPVALRQGFLDCYRKYGEAVDTAAGEYGWCYAMMWIYDPMGYACSFQWLLEVESAWFQFISCSAFPLRVE